MNIDFYGKKDLLLKCQITGKKTNNKWKGIPLCPEVVELAKKKKLEAEEKGKKLTTREVLLGLIQKIKDQLPESKDA